MKSHLVKKNIQDLGLKSIITTSDDIHIEPPKYLRRMEKKLKKAQKQLSKKKVNYRSQQNEIPEIKKMFPEYRNMHSLVIQDVVHRVDKAFDNFFMRDSGRIQGYGSVHCPDRS